MREWKYKEGQRVAVPDISRATLGARVTSLAFWGRHPEHVVGELLEIDSRSLHPVPQPNGPSRTCRVYRLVKYDYDSEGRKVAMHTQWYTEQALTQFATPQLFLPFKEEA